MIKTSTDANPYSTGELKLDDSHLDLCDSLQQMTEGLSYEVWRDKYRSHKEKTRQESAERVTYAIMGKDESADLTDYYWAILLGLWMPAGRILAGAGANKRVTLMNCFSGDTEVFTKEYGTIALKELAGRTASVLTKSGWIPSEFKCFGMQKTNTITLKCSRSNRRRKVVRATPNHRWLLKLGGETTDLKVGHLLRSCSAFVEGDREEYRAGLFHGIVFGDGQLHRQTLREVSGGYPLETFHHVLRACGRVADHYELLDEFCANYKQPPAAKGDRIYYHHGSENFKDFPHGKSADYIQGFIDGWWIADGHYENRGTQRCISSTNYEHLDWLIKNAPLGGYIITGDKIIGKEVTNLGRAKSPCRAVTIMQETHVKGWEVESIEEGHVEPVYCAVVPGEAAFTLSEGLYTGNCYVNQTIDDSMDSILDSLKIAALTMQQGGGIGTDFSTIRPAGAWLTRTGTPASGPGPFMDMWDSMCRTIMSAGARRGAMMGTLSDTHPFLPEFIKAKQTAGRWTMFNISILVSDAFMGAVTEDEDWLLHFPVAPEEDSRKADLEDLDFIDDDGVKQYVYSVWKARELWELITRNTYEYSEPGVIFIDRINELNNLHYCEEIRCTNPCVTGDTLILTDHGHLPIKSLVGTEVNIWNGVEFSKVVPFSTGINDLLEVTFSNGQTVRCTPYHKWVLSDGLKVEARDLRRGDKLLYAEMPTITDGVNFHIDAYSQGFYSGDGTKDSEQSNLYKHNEGIKSRLVGKFWERNYKAQPGVRWVHGRMLPKDLVPITAHKDYCINWLAGLLDADGCVSKKHSSNVLEISAKDRNFLRRVGLMLNRLGVNYRMWERADEGLKTGTNGKTYMCENTATLMISGKGANQLVQLGLKCERVDLSSFQTAPKGVARVGHRVVSIAPAGREETFCFNEPRRNMGVFNGVIGHNCGEQPLPPHGTCNLGAVNLALMVRRPFSESASFNFELLKHIVKMGIRFLDNVINVTQYPLPEQQVEEFNKRRLGLGITGLADALAQMRLRYGSFKAAELTERIMQVIAITAYETSIELAKERGSFPLFDAEQFLAPNTFAGSCLPSSIQDDIRKHGIRNSHLLTIAPTGTTSVCYWNTSSGVEPVFAHHVNRKVLQPDNSWKTYREWGYGARLYHLIHGKDTELPGYMVTMEDLSVDDHIIMQAKAQRWVDASVSKTVNCPEDISYENFVRVYELAYNSGCKGCTTYRPSSVRGSILSSGVEAQQIGVASSSPNVSEKALTKRSKALPGITYQIKWPSRSAALYLTINHDDSGLPYEIFVTSKDATNAEWVTALTLMITAIWRRGGDVSFVPGELQQIQSIHDGAFLEGRYFGSLPAYLGYIIEEHMKANLLMVDLDPASVEAFIAELPSSELSPASKPEAAYTGVICPSCKAPALVKAEGCSRCTNCGYSTC